MKWDKIISSCISIFCGIASSLLGTWDIALRTLVILMTVDYSTGIMCAYQLKTLSSQVGFMGILKKVMILAVIAVSVSVDNVMGTKELVRNVALFFYIGMEGISILENAARMGVGIPDRLKESLIQLKEGNKKEVKED